MTRYRPNKGSSSQENPALVRPASSKKSKPNLSGKRKVIYNSDRSSGNGNSGGSGGRGGLDNGDNSSNRPPETSPWLQHPLNPEPNPAEQASFVEYLRWMRSPDSTYKDPTKVEILQKAENEADYREHLERLTNRTKRIAGDDNWFQVTCSWRIRVGGHRGPESILLPAFDALGMPYIPSSTLRGVARSQAIREFMKKDDCSWRVAEKKVAPWFGSLNEEGCDRTGKVIFLDAYPLPKPDAEGRNTNLNSGGLKMDIANNIWNWTDDKLEYKSNPNPFLSLQQSSFIIGLRLRSKDQHTEIIESVKQWLEKGLTAGIGSQINTGYGVMDDFSDTVRPFLQVPFKLEGQLIHGYQKVHWQQDKRGKWKAKNISQEEVRTTALKSMLRYWFRALTLGFLEIGSAQEILSYQKATRIGNVLHPPASVKALEALLFGSITPQCWGWITVNATGQTIQTAPQLNYHGKKEPCGKQGGHLKITCSPSLPQRHTSTVKELFNSLVWLMFHLGGVGQGARRPVYNRKNSDGAPWYRGTNLIPDVTETYGSMQVPDKDVFWELPDSAYAFKKLFHKHLNTFYSSIEQLTGSSISIDNPSSVKNINHPHEWVEAVDNLCHILVVEDLDNGHKPTALDLLHESFHAFEDDGDLYNAKNLCGHTKEDKIPPPTKQGKKLPVTKSMRAKQKVRKATPSPIWVTDLDGKYQVVTIFGCSQDPRKQFLNDLHEEVPQLKRAQIWPVT